jgi:hypothetical protein
MKHAGPDSLARVEPLLERLRALDELTERKPGIFYLRSSAFLHFHEDPQGLFVDVKLDGKTFARLAVDSPAQREKLLSSVRRALAGKAARRTASPS